MAKYSPRPLPVFQCWTLKNGRAWYASAREWRFTWNRLNCATLYATRTACPRTLRVHEAPSNEFNLSREAFDGKLLVTEFSSDMQAFWYSLSRSRRHTLHHVLGIQHREIHWVRQTLAHPILTVRRQTDGIWTHGSSKKPLFSITNDIKFNNRLTTHYNDRSWKWIQKCYKSITPGCQQ